MSNTPIWRSNFQAKAVVYLPKRIPNPEIVKKYHDARGHYNVFKSEDRKQEILEEIRMPKTNIRTQIYGLTLTKVKLNKLVRDTDSKIEELQEIATTSDYIREKSKWNSGSKR